MKMKEIQTPASTCEFGNIRDSLLIDRIGCGMSDPTWLERLLRGRFHPAEMRLNSKDSKTAWEKAPSNDNHWFRINTVKQNVKDKVTSRSRLTQRTNAQFMYKGKKYKGRRKEPTKGQPWKGMGKPSRICCSSEWTASGGREGKPVCDGELATVGWEGWWIWLTEDIRTESSITDGNAEIFVKRTLTQC